MLARDLFARATTAASIALASGFEETSLAFQELALAIYGEMSSEERRSMIDGEDNVSPERHSPEKVAIISSGGVLLTSH